MRMIFGVITTLLGTLDQRQFDRNTSGKPDTPFGSNPAEVETLERELAQAHAYYVQSSQRQAQLDYLTGMLAFLAFAIAGTVTIALATGVLDKPVTVSVLAGATGAVVSVMNRMTTGRLVLRPESGKKTIRALGFMRPVIGAVFGAVIYLFLDGGIVEVLSPPQGGANLAFYAGLGFVSGFSERFAQDVIAQATPAVRGRMRRRRARSLLPSSRRSRLPERTSTAAFKGAGSRGVWSLDRHISSMGHPLL